MREATQQMQGFKTCADVAKAEAEGEVVIYSTSPEAAARRCSPCFARNFPKIKTNYVRLQAGALYAKVLAERQARSYLVDAMQISDMGMVLDFQKKGGYVITSRPRWRPTRPEGKKPARRLLDLGRDRPGRHRVQSERRLDDRSPKTWQDLLDPKWTDESTSRCPIPAAAARVVV